MERRRSIAIRWMKNHRRLLLWFIIDGIFAVAIITCLGRAWSICQQTMEHAPTAPIYPGAILMGEDTVLGNYPHADAFYNSTDSPEKIIKFYEEKTRNRCYKTSRGTSCIARANPFGQYTVYINEQSFQERQVTAFSIHFSWEACRGELLR